MVAGTACPTSSHPASCIESSLVKSPHPLSEIAARISRANRASVRPILELARQNGSSAMETSTVLEPSLDPLEATVAALESPVEFPPLSAGIVPGDRVAIALDEAVPCVSKIVRGALRALKSAGAEADLISVVASDAVTHKLCRDARSTEEADGVKFFLHDPDDKENLCFVGLTKQGHQLRVNRLIFDADVVLPIGCARLHSRGAFECLFPQFSDSEAIQRYRTPTNVASAAERESEIRETNEAGWLIGVPMVVEVVPGSGESVAHVLAGDPKVVARRSQELARMRWSLASPQQVSLMIATVTGGPVAQNWTSIGRVLATAEQLVEDGGALAICSNLSEPPGHSLGRLIGTDDLAKAERKIARDHDADSWPAWQLARALQRGPVYFLSQLEPETVEDLGLAPVESVDELVRLAERHESVAVVEDSQYAVVTVADEANER